MFPDGQRGRARVALAPAAAHLLEPVPVHAAAHGSVAGRSVRTALAPHAGQLTGIRMDLEAFFPSIAAGRSWGLLRTAGLPAHVAHTVMGC